MSVDKMDMIDDNRFFKILRNLKDNQTHYAASYLFYLHALEVWQKPKLKYTVKHEYTHIVNIFTFIEDLFSNFNDDEVLKLLGQDYIFILIASVCSHDMGLQRYHEHLDNISKRKKFTHHDELLIRVSHSDVISIALTNIKSISSLKAFFDKNALAKFNGIFKNKKLINDVFNLIINKSRKIAIVCDFHNKPFRDLEPIVANLVRNKSIKFIKDEKTILFTIVACLQIGDALDMSIDRIDVDDFEKKLKEVRNLPNIGVEDIDILNKMFYCYLIDNITSEKHRQNDYVSIDYYYRLVLSEHNRNEHYGYALTAKDAYLKRLRRKSDDGLNFIKDILNINVNLKYDEAEIEFEDDKILIPDLFFKIVNQEYFPTIDETFINPLVSLEKYEPAFTYIKLFSPLTEIFFDGACVGLDENEKYLHAVESYFICEEDFNLEDNQNTYFVKTSQIKKFIKNENIFKGMHSYHRAIKELKIKSEIYHRIIHKNMTIAFVNIHYKKVLSKNQQAGIKKYLREKLNTLGINIIGYYKKDYNEMKEFINSHLALGEKSKNILKKLYANKFDPAINYKKYYDKIRINEIKEMLPGSRDYDNDTEYYIKISRSTFNDIIVNLSILLSNLYPTEVKIRKMINQKSISIVFNIKAKQPTMNFVHATAFLSRIDNKMIDINRKLRYYLTPVKILTSVYGGKVIPTLSEENTKLKIDVRFPIFQTTNI